MSQVPFQTGRGIEHVSLLLQCIFSYNSMLQSVLLQLYHSDLQTIIILNH